MDHLNINYKLGFDMNYTRRSYRVNNKRTSLRFRARTKHS